MPDLSLRPTTVDNGRRRGWRATLTIGRTTYTTEHEIPAGALFALVSVLADELDRLQGSAVRTAARMLVNSAVPTYQFVTVDPRHLRDLKDALDEQ